MTVHLPFAHSYATLPDRFYTHHQPEPVSDPHLIVVNYSLADELGLKLPQEEAAIAALFAGTQLPETAKPIAQAYAGHQFGNFVPQLGDGRALLLGEVEADGKTRDIVLKGSGRTAYSRMGDGRAWLGPVLREYLMSEAMNALGVPTTRALAAVTTGDSILRENGPVPGAIFTRVAASHIRCGTFQYFGARGDRDGVQRLTEYTIARHYPNAADAVDLLHEVMAAQAKLIARWMSIGFIHGVMNTDNMTISGETIDYGPCAFIDDFHPMTVYSAIDRHGRYAYANQPRIAHWNLAQFASALIPAMPDEEAAVEQFTAIINRFPALYEDEWLSAFAPKLGIAEPLPEDRTLIEQLLQHMTETQADFTESFCELDRVSMAFSEWRENWLARHPDEELMRATNPRVIPRLHNIEGVIQAGLADDFAPFHRMLSAILHPFDVTDEFYTQPPQDSERVTRTFCGT